VKVVYTAECSLLGYKADKRAPLIRDQSARRGATYNH